MAAFPVTPLAGATTVLAVALVANAAIAAWAMLGGVRAPRGAALGTAAAVAIALIAAAAAWYGVGERVWPPAIGLALGAAGAALLPAPADADDGRADLAMMAGGLAALAALALALGAGVPLANAAIGLLTGAAATAAALRLGVTMPEAAEVVAPKAGWAWPGGGGLAIVALAAGAGAWGEKLWPEIGAGWPLALALGTAAAAATALATKLPAGPARAFAPAAAFGLAALAILAGLYGAATPLLVAVAAGAVGAAVLPALLADRADLAPLGKLAFLAAGGALLVLDNRLLGIVAIGFGGLGLATGFGASAAARAWLGLLAAVFAARVWIQLFLDRTALTGYGVDLTHPYAFAALIGGALVPAAAHALRRAAGGHAGLAGAAGVALVLAPAAVGYFIHVEAMGAWLAGLALATFAAAALEPERAPGEPALLLANVGVVLLAAPWLVEVMNATRQARVTALVVVAVGLAALAAWWWAARGRVRPAA